MQIELPFTMKCAKIIFTFSFLVRCDLEPLELKFALSIAPVQIHVST